MRSITEVLFPLGDTATVHPGHGPETTIRRERTTNPFMMCATVDEFLELKKTWATFKQRHGLK